MTRATSPFHAGEHTIQSLAGVRDRIERKGRAVIRDYMPEEHRAFFAALSFMVVGLADQNGHPWATSLSGPPGFMNSADENQLTIKAWLDPGDPLHSCFRDGVPIGGLGIELSTRRRNRINGRIENCIIGEGFSIRVQQSFGNCPKYIQARNERTRLRSKPVPESRMASHLGDNEVSFIAEADTFFIASRSAQLDQEEPSQGLDVSHRGGLPGFVRVVSRTELCFPDFSGNLLFNTLGNLEADARAGLLFIDFRSGGMLHIIGGTRICWDVPEATRSAGIERLVFLDIQCVLNREHAFPHLFDFVSYSPHLGGGESGFQNSPISGLRTPDTRRRLRPANRNGRLRRGSKEKAMLNLTRRNALLTAACAGAAFGLPKPVSFIEAALAQKGPEAGKGFRPFKFGMVHGFILNDGVWEKPHDPAFIANVSIEETKAALAAAGIANEVVPIPFNITLLKFGNETVLFDAGTGGQFQPTAGAMIANMAAADIKPAQITRVIVSHFHPDHVFGLMSKAPDNTPVFPNAAIYVPSTEFKFWMDPAIFTRLPEGRHGLPKRLQAMFPLLKDKVIQYEWDTEVIPGIRSIAAPGHTPGHTAFVVASGKEQLMVLSDATNMPALFAKHPSWHGQIDADPVLAEATRRRLFDRAVSDKALVTGYHFPFPAVGTIVPDGTGYTFVPAA